MDRHINVVIMRVTGLYRTPYPSAAAVLFRGACIEFAVEPLRNLSQPLPNAVSGNQQPLSSFIWCMLFLAPEGLHPAIVNLRR